MTARIEPFPSDLAAADITAEPADDADGSGTHTSSRPSREAAEDAVRTLIAYLGDDPDREGLIDTPARVIDAYGELFGGYGGDAGADLARTFDEVAGYSDMVLVRDVPFHSHCEHHMMPIEGVAHIAYLPAGRIVGFSKLARTLDTFARRLQTQEALTMEVAGAIEAALAPRGLVVQIEAQHACMVMRGIAKAGVSNVTSHASGAFAEDAALRRRFDDQVSRR